MPLDFGRPERPARPASQKLEIAGLEIAVDAAGLLVVARRGTELLRTNVLLPQLAPTGERSPGDPELSDGRLTKEDVFDGRHCFRLVGSLPHPRHPETPLAYEARFHLGPAPLLSVEYVRLRNPGASVVLAHWEHHLPLADVQGYAIGDGEAIVGGAVGDLALEAGSGQTCIAVADGGQWLSVDSEDVAAYGQGALVLSGDPPPGAKPHLSLHRITPGRAYCGVLEAAAVPVAVDRGAALSFSFTLDLSSEYRRDTASPRRPAPLRRDRPDEILLLHGAAVSDDVASDDVASRLRSKVEAFTITDGPHAGLHHGGYDHLNGRFVETPGNRAECGEFLLNEYFRSDELWWLEGALRFGRAHLDLMYLVPPVEGDHGGARRQGGTGPVSPLRSCRGAHLYLHLHALTGDPAYLTAARASGEYVLRHAAEPQVTLVGSCPQLAALWYHTGGGQFGTAARDLAVQVAARQNSDGSWHQWYDADGTPGRGPLRVAGEVLDQAPVQPQVVAECVVGLLDMVQIQASAEGIEAARRALDWLVSVQRDEGAWGFPSWDSSGLCGQGAFLAATAMFRGYQRFDDERYLQAGRRVFEWALKTWDDVGYIPAIVGRWPHDLAEASVVYFWGLEAAALWRELAT